MLGWTESEGAKMLSIIRTTKRTRQRANLALLMLASCFGDGFDATECRKYDGCFENYDGNLVVFEIMRQAFLRDSIMAILKRYPACKYVAFEDWQATYNQLLKTG